jgi:signal peptidase I
LRLEARDCKLVVRDVRLYRDAHYTQFGDHGTHDENGHPNPARLGTKEYFVLGDNSGNSQDSRKWPHPAVPEGEIIGKPFLIHQPLRPGKMTIGGRERHYQTVDWSRLRWLH